MTYAEYKAQMTRNREQLEQNERELQLESSDLDAFRRLPRPLNVLALAEDWCGDVIANLPVVGRLEQESDGKLNVRVLLRDQQPGSRVMDLYLKDGQFRSIPVFVFLDQDFNEVGVFIERPESVTQMREQRRQALYQQHPEWGDPNQPIAELPENVRAQVQRAVGAMRNETKPFASAEVVRELRQLVERASLRQPV